MDEKLFKNILVYDISYKTFIGAKQLRTRCDKLDGFIIIYGGNRNLGLFDPEKYDPSTNKLDILQVKKSGITYVFSHNYAKIKITSYDSLPES